MMQAEVPNDVGKTAAHIDRPRPDPLPSASSDRADASGMSVDQRRADRRPFEQAEIARGPTWSEADAQRRAGCDDLRSNFRVAVRGEVSKTDALEIAAAPAVLVGKEIPLASERAY